MSGLQRFAPYKSTSRRSFHPSQSQSRTSSRPFLGQKLHKEKWVTPRHPLRWDSAFYHYPILGVGRAVQMTIFIV
ncbi:hypothetical protein E2C01_037651 [Portunus trituberculatus]|uniref:Uncharacterized protein n=1 Tax=Portunus trituberculatus TaxID=210409 RepID=A0A5B7FC05_PORTR|nr:hypothetical protein [Portunus trituberculatus]